MHHLQAVAVAPRPDLADVAGRRVDWADEARVVCPNGVDSLTWARACFEGAPAPMRYFLLVGWTLLLLERGDGDRVLGWPIVRADADAVLARRSRLGLHATLVFTATGEGASFASAMCFEHRLARVVWAAVAPIHRWAVRYVLTHAARALSTTDF